MDRGLAFYFDEVPAIEIRDDNMHFTWPTLEVVVPVRTAMAGMAASQEAIAKWQYGALGTGAVFLFPPRN